MPLTTNEIADEILTSKKYSGIDRVILERICTETIPKYTSHKDIVKAVKKELHIIHNSFLFENCYTKADVLIDAYSGEGLTTDKAFAKKLMSLHASTRERLKQADEIYAYLSAFINAEDVIIDTGCGFNPFALPFYTVLPKSYIALDISLSSICILTKYFRRANLPFRAEIYDAVVQAPCVKGDIILLLKLLPLLERQKKGLGFTLLEALDYRTVIVSFPTKSVSGKEKGMETFYACRFEAELPKRLTVLDKKVFANEMFYVLSK